MELNLDQLKKTTESVCQTALNASNYILSEYNKVRASDIEIKDLNSLVSYVDKTAEKMIVDGLKPLIPEAQFYTEEATEDRSIAEYTWIIDPLDGTTNYLHQIPVFSVSIALLYQNELVIGVIQDCTRHDTYAAWKDGGAYINGKPISVSSAKQLADSTLATGFPYYDFNLLSAYMDLLSTLMQRSRGLRRFGSAAIDLAYVAAGRFDGFFEYGLKPWDVAAGLLIVKEAGGTISTFSLGDTSPLWDGELMACNRYITRELQDCISEHLDQNAS